MVAMTVVKVKCYFTSGRRSHYCVNTATSGKKTETSALYRHRKEIVEISGSLSGVAVESGAQRCQALFLGEWLRAFRTKVMPSSSRCQQSVPSKLRNAFTQLHNVASQKNFFLRNQFSRKGHNGCESTLILHTKLALHRLAGQFQQRQLQAPYVILL